MVQSSAVVAIEKKIQETESNVAEIRKAAETLMQLEADLNALKRTKALLMGTEYEAIPPPAMKSRKNSGKLQIGDMGVEVIQEAGHPLHLNEIYSKLQGKGYECSKPALAVALLRFTKKEGGPIKKTGPNVFGMND